MRISIFNNDYMARTFITLTADPADGTLASIPQSLRPGHTIEIGGCLEQSHIDEFTEIAQYFAGYTVTLSPSLAGATHVVSGLCQNTVLKLDHNALSKKKQRADDSFANIIEKWHHRRAR